MLKPRPEQLTAVPLGHDQPSVHGMVMSGATERARTMLLALALVGLSAAAVRAQAPSAADRYIGDWVGALVMPAGTLRLALTVARDSSAGLTAVMTSLDQGNVRIITQRFGHAPPL